MNTDKIWIRDIAEICAAKGVRYAVISPGSRSAPLVIAFSRQPEMECLTVIDERSAAFFALGIAQQTGTPVVLICTSGSATLNYAPAIAEAYHQRVPLFVLTADRPDELIDQRDGQTIRQNNLYHNYIRRSFHLPVVGEQNDDRWYVGRMISEAIDASLFPVAGPVHVNVPLREPLYTLKENPAYTKPKFIEQLHIEATLSNTDKKSLLKEWGSYKSKMILAGAQNEERSADWNYLLKEPSVAVLTESTSNLSLAGVISAIDPALESLPEHEKAAYSPELVVTLGGEIVSKKIKAFLRAYRPKAHWHVDLSGCHVDTFKSLTKVIGVKASEFLKMIRTAPSRKSDYRNKWLQAFAQARKTRTAVLRKTTYCDFTLFPALLNALPPGCNLHLGNSTPVRYANLFEVSSAIHVNCNRGVSGIDGTVSTAAGAAYASKKLTVLITGDVSFFYDSNALWNKHLPKNLRIILINNAGGNIFRIIPGPSSLSELEEYFETKQEQTARHIARAFHLPYYFCDDMASVKKQLKTFFKETGKPALLEIKTPNEVSAKVLREYMNMK